MNTVKTPAMNSQPRPAWPAVWASFRGLDAGDPSQWPVWPRRLLLSATFTMVLVVLWTGWLSAVQDQWLAEQAHEEELRSDFRQKLRQTVNKVSLQQQRDQLQQHIQQLEQSLPSQAEMETRLSDINRLGLERRLQFELFRPGPPVNSEHHVEWPIALRVTGTYHDLAGFAADIARLRHTVVLGQLSLSPVPDRPGVLTLECVASAFRLLAPQERASPPAQPLKP